MEGTYASLVMVFEVGADCRAPARLPQCDRVGSTSIEVAFALLGRTDARLKLLHRDDSDSGF
jgi:hypothetical protein